MPQVEEVAAVTRVGLTSARGVTGFDRRKRGPGTRAVADHAAEGLTPGAGSLPGLRNIPQVLDGNRNYLI